MRIQYNLLQLLPTFSEEISFYSIDLDMMKIYRGRATDARLFLSLFSMTADKVFLTAVNYTYKIHTTKSNENGELWPCVKHEYSVQYSVFFHYDRMLIIIDCVC